jgi:hypothetical protein
MGAEMDGYDLEEALGLFVLENGKTNIKESAKTNPFYWEPFHLGDDPRKRGLLENFLDFFGRADLIGKPPGESYINMQIMKLLLSQMLQEEALHSIGYLLPRKPDDKPIAIPSDVWFGSIDWQKN